LPDPCQDHALVMAKFAMDCLTTLDQVAERLIPELGPDTSTLKLRVGLHSGPVVAGVLRGDKCRFQLFGDTMNTASRMESTGLPSTIQVSQETADLLITAGKKSWLTQREDAVIAKGKGELVTFFVSRMET
jgi:class 3 adenylate cyclase